ncbi:flagellar hook-associated protein 3 [Yersinia mollaretii]|uniref:flagellar hook-associated protein FlgL n=1 Tax=Yersinia mollaretii TaxID=33060 RepID=UPI0005DED721|nr:flagellar hook-associated protein FlgL [Yersinia mollaretii]MDA5528373.1 flagellar hook-associated protein FlgL [Yersinia mollaretii]MDA5535569.1 flagellar hook-associated protein FlgL [Yersinia mollaretii]MDR7874340.1 flagellar hook-associated protein FlgL [Yersinia mollaretii]NIL03550.1 flagellar hook-associated protein 3 [Yersinia mollaretii]PHZ32481.1 flagellar hook-associated protein 3 [Yersinia mollaretii]
MRLSTQYMFQSNINSMSNAMNAGNDIYMQLSAQRTLLTPSDDPAGASQAVIYQNALANMQQFDTARLYAQDALEQEDNTLTSIGHLLTKNLSEKIVAGGNGALSDADRQALATELQGIRDNLLDLGNTTNSNGRYIFGGYKTGSAPFEKDGTYVGGDTAMTQHVADSTEMQVGHIGSDVFMSGSNDDIFAALDSAIAALNEPIVDDADREALQKTLDSANISIKKGIDNLGKVQAQVGTNLQQIDSLAERSAVEQINMQSRLQQTVGSDPSTMITLASQSKMTEFALNSSMMVFQSMQKLSIFNM